MRILLVTPAPPRTVHGNRVTALRWARLLRSLGHRVRVRQDDDGSPADLLIALHARRSAAAILRVRAKRPTIPVVLALTGTDLYPSLAEAGVDPGILAAADRLIILQPLALDQLPDPLRARTRVIYQSARSPSAQGLEQGRSARLPGRRQFTVALLAHLRPVKDPLLPARAMRLLPRSSLVRVTHAGAVIDPALGERAAAESHTNPRYTWHGALPPARARRLLAASSALVHPSRQEGGANVVTEALAMGVPVVATRIPGTVGILGPDYPGYFPVGDPAALANLLNDLEGDADRYGELRHRCEALRTLTDPARERASWQSLLGELNR